ncbi:MAG: PAS domain S-box protein [Vicinamibacterales bacterium]
MSRDDPGVDAPFPAPDAPDRAAADLRRWQRAFDRAGIGIALVDASTNTFVRVNDAYARLRGFTVEALTGQSVVTAYPPGWHARLRERIAEADRAGHVVFEAEVLHARGTTVPVLVDLTSIPAEHGQPASRLAFVIDLTERRRAEAAAQVWGRAFAQADLPIALYTPEGRITAVNASFARTRGFTPDELIGASVDRLLPAEEQARVHAGIARNEDHRAVESVHMRRDGSTFPVFADVTAIRDDAGAMVGRVGFFTDLTAQKEAEAVRREAEQALLRLNVELEHRVDERTSQLREANDELEAFAYSVSHDLRAPLRGIAGWSQALLEDCGGQLDAQGRAHLDRVLAEAARMGALIDDLLGFSRVGRVPLVLAPTDVSAIATRVAARLRESHRGRRVEVHVAPGLTAHADAKLLDVVLTNLLDNAIKFTARRDVADIECGAIEGEPGGFFVRDNGVGFDPAFATKLFAPFQRLHRASDYPGTGIGLATVQRIVHRHGGRVWAESQPDHGATFYVTLPPAS